MVSESKMREILFRGKTNDGEWLEGFYAIFSSTPFIGAPNHYGTMLWSAVKSKTVGQFTGLADKNGKRIFEGDIVRVERDLWHGENKIEREVFNGVVWYDEKHTCFGIKSEKYRCLPIHRFKGDYVTVIGNIHDNPELLNGTES